MPTKSSSFAASARQRALVAPERRAMHHILPGRNDRDGCESPRSRCRARESCLNRRIFWNVRAMPSRTRRCAGNPDEIGAVERQRAGVGLIDAADQVEQRRLAGAVRPDDREDRRRPEPRTRCRDTARTPPKFLCRPCALKQRLPVATCGSCSCGRRPSFRQRRAPPARAHPA